MEMSEVFENLKKLQDILSEKYSIEALIEDAPKRLSTQEEDLQLKKKDFIVKSALYDEKRKLVGSLKTKLAEAIAAREKGEKGMDSITTHREYEALQKEIDEASALEQQIRKDLQKEEKNLAELNESLDNDRKNIDSSVEEYNDGLAVLDSEIEGHKGRLAELESEEKQYEEGIDPDIIFKFERIIKSKQGKGIVAVKGNVCDGCHMILPAQFANEVHDGEKIVFCPYCSRILFYQELKEGEQEYSQIEDLGSLAGFGDDDDEFYDDEYDEDDFDRDDSVKAIDVE
jgi:predicted  nucleic acid-binding Zn-ribbon protein